MKPLSVVGKDAVTAELSLWEYKGHEPEEKLCLIRFKNGRVALGVLSYENLETVLLAEDKTYENCQQAFTAMGARFDAMKRTSRG